MDVVRRFPGGVMDIAYQLPDRVIENSYFAAKYPKWNVAQTEKRTGVLRRHVAGSDETAYDIALKATIALLDRQPHLVDRLDAIIFCTQSPDYVMPSNAFLLQRDLGMKTQVLAYDYNLGCSGFVYGLLMASGFISTGIARNVLLVTADTYSKHISDDDRATRMLFGDGAAATWVAADGEAERVGIVPLISQFTDFLCETDGRGWESVYIKSGAYREPPDRRHVPGYDDRMRMNGLQVLNFVSDRVPHQVRTLLENNGLRPQEIDHYYFHQASRVALDSLRRSLQLDPDKIHENLESVGNVVSASIPILIRDHFEKDSPEVGCSLLLGGYGVGYSWASLLARR